MYSTIKPPAAPDLRRAPSDAFWALQAWYVLSSVKGSPSAEKSSRLLTLTFSLSCESDSHRKGDCTPSPAAMVTMCGATSGNSALRTCGARGTAAWWPVCE